MFFASKDGHQHALLEYNHDQDYSFSVRLVVLADEEPMYVLNSAGFF